MRFFKMHGTGNDFVILENLKNEPLDYPSLAKLFCAPHTGIGADGVILVLPSDKADFRMRIFNSDGSEAEMCGNGVRCFARHVYEHGLTTKKSFRLETLAGIVEPECAASPSGKVERVRVKMGSPRYGDLHPKAGEPLDLKSDILAKISFDGAVVEGGTVSMGNPHFVIFPDARQPWSMEAHGRALSVHPSHPHQSNVEFVEILSPNRARVKVWERGVGPTQACGSGACASLAAARIMKGIGEKITVEMPGGPLEVEWDGAGAIYLTGPAAYVFEGEISKELLDSLRPANAVKS